MKKLLFFIAVMAFGLYVCSQDALWSRVENAGNMIVGRFVETDEFNNVYVGALDMNLSVCIVKYDSEGNKLLTLCDVSATDISDMAIGSDGKIYWAGQKKDGSGGVDAILSVYNPDGSLHFSQTFDHDGQNDYFNDLEVGDDGAVYVVGNSATVSTEIPVIIKYQSNGSPQWVQQIVSGGVGIWLKGFKISLDSDGYVYVACKRSFLMSTNRNISIFRYSDEGEQLDPIEVLTVDDDIVNISSMLIDNNDNIYLAGYSGTLSTSSGFCAKTTKEELLWSKTLESSNGLLRLQAACFDDLGNFILAGFNDETDGTGFACGYSPSGAGLFAIYYDGIGYGEERFQDVVSSGPNLYLTGYCSGIGTGIDILTLCLGEDREVAWDVTFNGFDNGPDKAHSIALDADKNILVTGYSSTMGSTYCTTLKYSNPLKINDPGLQLDDVSLYPNPAGNHLNICVSENAYPLNYRIYNSVGQQVHSGACSGTAIDISQLEKGLFFIQFEIENKAYSLKFVRDLR